MQRSPAGNGLTSWLSCVCAVFLCACHFPMWCPGSGVVLDLSIPDLCLLTYYEISNNVLF